MANGAPTATSPFSCLVPDKDLPGNPLVPYMHTVADTLRRIPKWRATVAAWSPEERVRRPRRRP